MLFRERGQHKQGEGGERAGMEPVGGTLGEKQESHAAVVKKTWYPLERGEIRTLGPRRERRGRQKRRNQGGRAPGVHQTFTANSGCSKHENGGRYQRERRKRLNRSSSK